MEREQYLGCLAADQARLRSLAARDVTSAVPTCPGWTTADLVRHVAAVYLHKVECMRRGEFPRPWPPPGLAEEEPVGLLDRAYAALHHEFAVRSPADPAPTFYGPQQTVGFWLRRMAQETVVHRVDAELAVRVPVGHVPDALAVDGVDEVLRVFLAYGSQEWPEDFAAPFDGADARAVRVDAGDGSWLVRLAADGVRLDDPVGSPPAAATVAGSGRDVLLWLWRRADDRAVSVVGDTALVARLQMAMREATQ